MKFSLENINKYSVASDTDSTFITLKPILEKQYPNLDFNNKEEVLPKIRILQREIGDKLNKYQTVLAKNILNCDEHCFELKPEFIVKRALWTGKRRYAQHLVDREGRPIDKIVLMGLEVIKSNQNKLFKTFGENLIKNILINTPKDQIDNSILEFHRSLKTIDPRLLGKPSGVSYINKCIKRPATSGEIFSELNINTKQNSRAAIVYNDLLKFKGLDKSYESVIEGDKIFVINLKPNPYKLEVIGFPNSKMPPEIIKFIETYIDIEEIFESAIKNKIDELYDDLKWDVPSYNPNVAKFFSFG